jgi:hypothetical protein
MITSHFQCDAHDMHMTWMRALLGRWWIDDLRSKALVGIVGGSDLIKQKEQLGEHC